MSLPCPLCLAPLASGAERCGACGHAPAAPTGEPVAVDGQSLEICPGCGVIAVQNRSRCEVCDHEYPSPRPRAPRLIADRLFWVAVRARFKCRACAHKSPLNHLDMDGSVLCVACGVDQAFKSRGWTRPLKHAHGVGDLSGPDPEGRFPNPELSIAEHNAFSALGVDETWSKSVQQGTSAGGGSTAHESLELEAAPGHPLCERCRAPLSITIRTAELITLKCHACEAPERSYPIPPQAAGVVAGVLTPEQASGQLDIDVLVDGGGAVLVKCPNCTAPLDLSGACSVVACQFCRVTSRLPGSVLLKLGFKSVKPLVWWLLFEGPSSRRTEAEQLARGALKRQQKKQQRRGASGAPRKGRKQAKPKQSNLLVIVVIVVLGVIALAAVLMART